MTKTGIIVLAHGSRGERGSLEVPEILGRITQRLKLLLFLSHDIEICGAALQFNLPNLDEAAKVLIEKGCRCIVIAPYFLFLGRHLTEDVPEKVENLKSQNPGVQFTVAANLGLNGSCIESMADKIIEVCPSLLQETAAFPVAPELIEEQSMQIIEQLLPPDLEGDERLITRRIIHAGGDLSLADLVKFSPTAIISGIEAIKRGVPIFTDVHMTAAGVSPRLVKQHGISVICTLDRDDPENVDAKMTRSARSMYRLGPKLNSAIIVIGNAPTALLAVIDMIDNRQLIPALVIGMPVGFVQARESKVALMKRQVPYITIKGNRGGSPLAAATVNALLRLAE